MADGSQYEGEYWNGLRHGKGTYQFYPSGAQYVGEWKKGAKHGKGKLNYPDGSCYWGDFKHNKRQGFGKNCYHNGDTYEGTWNNNVRHGVGTYNYTEVGVLIRAVWVEGLPKGSIKAVFPDFRYHGHWNGKEPVGEGTFSFGAKYMTTGHIELFPKVEAFEAFGMQDDSTAGQCLPRFVARDIEIYDENKLNRELISVPASDSLTSICSSTSSTIEVLSQSTGAHSNPTETFKATAGSLGWSEKISGIEFKLDDDSIDQN
jgi:hypothetical protein